MLLDGLRRGGRALSAEELPELFSRFGGEAIFQGHAGVAALFSGELGVFGHGADVGGKKLA